MNDRPLARGSRLTAARSSGDPEVLELHGVESTQELVEETVAKGTPRHEVHGIDDELPVTLVSDESGIAQDAEVMAGIALLEAKMLAELADGGGTLGQRQHQIQPGFVAQHSEYVGGGGHVFLTESPAPDRLDTHWATPDNTE